LFGGLGNQLFQYSAGLYLSRIHKSELLIRTDLLPERNDSIDNVSRWPAQIPEFRFEGTIFSKSNQPFGRTNFRSKYFQAQRHLGDLFPKVMYNLGVVAGTKNDQHNSLDQKPLKVRLLNTHYLSPIPANELGDDLRSQVRDILNPSKRFLELSMEALRTSPTMVHLRLGDYKLLRHVYGAPDPNAIGELLKRHSQKFIGPVWVFTDSPEDLTPKITQVLSPTRVIGPAELPRPIENLVLMSLGANIVCSNSTFSWWSAFLLGGRGNVYFPEGSGLPQTIFSQNMVNRRWRAF
jgi:hypothetical protein